MPDPVSRRQLRATRFSAAAAAASFVALPTPAQFHVHPRLSDQARDGNRVRWIKDSIAGMAGSVDYAQATMTARSVTGATSIKGPFAGTDPTNGLDFLRLTNQEGLGFPALTAPLAFSTQQSWEIMVLRYHRSPNNAKGPITGIGGGDGVNFAGAAMTLSTSGGTQWMTPQTVGKAITTLPQPFLSVGANLQVLAINRQTTGNGAIRIYNNLNKALASQQIGLSSGEVHLGYHAGTSPTPYAQMGEFDCYGWWAGTGVLNDTQFEANIAAVMAAYGIVEPAHLLVIAGDSNGYNVNPNDDQSKVTTVNEGSFSGVNLAMQLAYLLPNNVRIMSAAKSGAKVTDTRVNLDGASDYIRQHLFTGRGKNLFAWEPGSNDVATLTAAQLYGGTPASPATGVTDFIRAALSMSPPFDYFIHGWKSAMANPTSQAKVATYWGLLGTAAQWAADTLSGSGQANENKVKFYRPDQLTFGGVTVMDTSAKASNVTTPRFFCNDFALPATTADVHYNAPLTMPLIAALIAEQIATLGLA